MHVTLYTPQFLRGTPLNNTILPIIPLGHLHEELLDSLGHTLVSHQPHSMCHHPYILQNFLLMFAKNYVGKKMCSSCFSNRSHLKMRYCIEQQHLLQLQLVNIWKQKDKRVWYFYIFQQFQPIPMVTTKTFKSSKTKKACTVYTLLLATSADKMEQKF